MAEAGGTPRSSNQAGIFASSTDMVTTPSPCSSVLEAIQRPRDTSWMASTTQALSISGAMAIPSANTQRNSTSSATLSASG